MKKVVLLFFYILCFSTNIFAQEPKYTSSDEPDITHMDTPELRAYAAKKVIRKRKGFRITFFSYSGAYARLGFSAVL